MGTKVDCFWTCYTLHDALQPVQHQFHAQQEVHQKKKEILSKFTTDISSPRPTGHAPLQTLLLGHPRGQHGILPTMSGLPLPARPGGCVSAVSGLQLGGLQAPYSSLAPRHQQQDAPNIAQQPAH